ncbi:ATP-binding cassette domain-containing protein [Aliiroseovarius subalbicans]|uniref:ATP-binding cassette domain-containing protein n=1 Tax=Aliiroseovarius subalbicans TaxID=2925840 RepID=UPI001F573FE2|nr:ATP-binding cassette domain-containing protein [Aliiroseovarius subalbicans]MCI2399928.1 ATP-binding cassette domain-containing protein [Aliiroseovarius subalbicans]
MVTTILPLTLSGATAQVHGKRILGPVDLTLGQAGVTMVIGPNGAGKTTLLRLIHGLQRQSGGTQNWAVGVDEARAAQAFIFQNPVLMRRSVRDNIAYAARLTFGRSSTTDDVVDDWIVRVGLTEQARQPASSLSGGERQKMALARALIRAPQMLILDEPTAHLDGRSTREVEAILLDAVARDTRLVMSTHDMGQARRLGSDIVFLHQGQVFETGPATGFFTHPQTPEATAFLNGDILE